MHPKSRFSMCTKIILLFCLVFGQGCFTQNESYEVKKEKVSAKKKGGIYRIPIKNTPKSLDPLKVWNIHDGSITYQIFDRLVRFGPYLEIYPALAESWTIEENGCTYRFKIKKNAMFHNGDPVEPEDVVFSIKRMLRGDPEPMILPHLMKIVGARGYRAHSKNTLTGVKTMGDDTVLIRLETAHVPFLASLGTYQAAIVPRKVILDPHHNFEKFPIGAGPFRLDSYGEDGSVKLVRYGAYYSGPANLDGIYYKVYQTGQYKKIVEDFDKGRVEEIPIYGNAKQYLSCDKLYQWFQRPSLSLMFYGMNLQHPNLSSPFLREALNIVIDRSAFVHDVHGGKFKVARTILPQGMPGYRPLKLVGNNDLEAANELIKKAFPGGENQMPQLELVTANKSPEVEKELAMMAAFWKEIGVIVYIKYIPDWNQFNTYLRSDTVQLYRYAWYADLPDPDNFLYALFSSSSSNNFMQFQNRKVDSMLESAREILDPVKRIQTYQEIENKIMYETPLIPIMYLNINRAYQPYVRSINVNALGIHATSLYPTWLDMNSENAH